MKKTTQLSCVILLALTSSAAWSAALVPEQCTLGVRPLDRPLEYVGISFGEIVELTSAARAYVTHDGATVAEADTLYTDSQGNPGESQGWLHIRFPGDILPKGGHYILHVPAGSITPHGGGIPNEEIVVPFETPADLGEAEFGESREGTVITEAEGFSCSWMYEVYPVGNPEWELYREEELVRRYPAAVSSDWDLGTAYVRFEETLHFEKGVRYRLALPAGSVSAARVDIVNDEVSLDFEGGYTEPISSPMFYWCSLYGGIPDVIYEVSFYFGEPVILIPGRPIYFVDCGEPGEKWGAYPTLREEDGKWILTADFGGVALESGKGYTVEIPEGTLVTAEGDIAVNRRQTTETVSGIDVTASGSVSVSASGGEIIVSGIEGDTPVAVYDSGGRRLAETGRTDGAATFGAAGVGVCIVSVGGRTFRIVAN